MILTLQIHVNELVSTTKMTVPTELLFNNREAINPFVYCNIEQQINSMIETLLPRRSLKMIQIRVIVIADAENSNVSFTHSISAEVSLQGVFGEGNKVSCPVRMMTIYNMIDDAVKRCNELMNPVKVDFMSAQDMHGKSVKDLVQSRIGISPSSLIRISK